MWFLTSPVFWAILGLIIAAAVGLLYYFTDQLPKGLQDYLPWLKKAGK